MTSLVCCEVCGVVVPGADPAEQVICTDCLASRHAQLAPAPAPEALLQFDCIYCRSLLRLRPVGRRTRVRCPKCNEAFYLHEDGRIEAKLEGSRTAVLQQEDVNLLDLGQQKGAKEGGKTQPIRREDALQAGSNTEVELDLAPDPDAAPAQAPAPAPARATGKSRTGTQRLPREAPAPKKTGRTSSSRRLTARPRPAPEPGEEEAEEEAEERPRPGRTTSKRQRALRLAAAERKGQEVAQAQGRRLVGTLLAGVWFLLPLVLAAPLLLGVELPLRGRAAESLERFGRRASRALDTLNDQLPPAWRVPLGPR